MVSKPEVAGSIPVAPVSPRARPSRTSASRPERGACSRLSMGLRRPETQLASRRGRALGAGVHACGLVRRGRLRPAPAPTFVYPTCCSALSCQHFRCRGRHESVRLSVRGGSAGVADRLLPRIPRYGRPPRSLSVDDRPASVLSGWQSMTRSSKRCSSRYGSCIAAPTRSLARKRGYMTTFELA